MKLLHLFVTEVGMESKSNCGIAAFRLRLATLAVFCIAVKKATRGNTEIPQPIPQMPTSDL